MAIARKAPLRIKGHDGVRHVFESGRRFSFRRVALVVAPARDTTSPLRLAVAVRRGTKPAVRRNRYKRLLREAVRELLARHPELSALPLDIVAMWKPDGRHPRATRMHDVAEEVAKAFAMVVEWYSRGQQRQ